MTYKNKLHDSIKYKSLKKRCRKENLGHKYKELNDAFKQIFREENMRHIPHNDQESKHVDDTTSYLDVALDGCKKLNQDFIGTFDSLNAENEDPDNLTAEELKAKYAIQDEDVISRLISLRETITSTRQKDMNYDELLSFLLNAMNYDDMQIWLMRKEFQSVHLTLTDKLKKFFELKSNDKIIVLYDIQQNYNQNNIDSLKRELKQ